MRVVASSTACAPLAIDSDSVPYPATAYLPQVALRCPGPPASRLQVGRARARPGSSSADAVPARLCDAAVMVVIRRTAGQPPPPPCPLGMFTALLPTAAS